MRAVLVEEEAGEVPDDILALKYYRITLAPGGSAGSKPAGSDGYKHRRRNCLVRINSTELVHRRGGSSEQRPVPTFGTVFHYAAVYIDGRPKTLAYVEHVKSAKDRPGRYGYASTKFGIECVSGCEETRYYVPVGALAEVVGTMEREAVHSILFSREPFSDDQ